MGITDNNWPATVGIFTGVLAKEAVVGTLDALYGQMGQTVSQNDEKPEFNIKTALFDAWQTIPQNFSKLTDRLLDPLGFNIGNVQDLDTAASEQEVKTATFSAMQQSFDGKAGAFAYLLFILLYAPCVTAIAAIHRETSLNWTIFVVFWTTSIAYITATVFYQIMTYPQHPGYSLSWIFGLLLGFALVLAALWLIGRNHQGGFVQEAL